jgi:hypothetical protein
MTTVFRGLDRLLGVRYLRQVPDAQIYFSVLLAFIRAGKQVSQFHVLFMSSPRFPMLWIKLVPSIEG